MRGGTFSRTLMPTCISQSFASARALAPHIVPIKQLKMPCHTSSSLTSPFPNEPISAPLPYVPLQSSPGPAYSNYSSTTPPSSSSVNGALYNPAGTISGQSLPPYTCVAEGGTNISAALNGALAMFLPTSKTTPDGTKGLGLTRKGSTSAIVLFTDGLPTMGGDSGTSDPSAQAVATAAGSNGIPIYTIGLSLVSSLTADQTAVLTDTSGSTGIAALSGNGATFSQTSDSTTLIAIMQTCVNIWPMHLQRQELR